MKDYRIEEEILKDYTAETDIDKIYEKEWNTAEVVELMRKAIENCTIHGVSKRSGLLLFRKWQEDNWKDVYLYSDEFMVETYLKK